MWSDNAATVDLLGYEDLLHEIVDLAVDQSLQPLTVGAFADWGAGKSTLLNLAADALRERGALVVEFSPWLVEGYDDVKTCLLGAVVEAIEAVQEPAQSSSTVSSLLSGLRGRIDWLRLTKLGASAVVPFAGVAIEALQELLKPGAEAPKELTIAGSSEVSQGFHRDFEQLIEEIDEIDSVVVLIDDLDRCLPDQVIETLEAIRLFLATPGTAFVIAADERLVRDAVRHRYAQASEVEINLPQEYLEKLVQVAMRIPPLARPDTESYCNLLVAQRILDADDFDQVLEAAQQIRRSGELQVSCNVGIVREIFKENLPKKLEAEFGLIEQLMGPIASGLKGNPRQIKRYLNTLEMRRRTAFRRKISVDEAVLAKLVVLEYVRDDRYRELYEWQQKGSGLAEGMMRLEAALGDPNSVGSDAEIGAWVADSWTLDWITAGPRLAGVGLAPYFFLSRVSATDGGASSHLPMSLQALMPKLESDTPSIREAALDEATELPVDDQLMLLEACATRMKALPNKQPIMKSMIEIAGKQPALVPAIVAALSSVPYSEITADIPLVIVGRLTNADATEAVGGLLHAWEIQDASGPLSKSALRARRSRKDAGGNI